MTWAFLFGLFLGILDATLWFNMNPKIYTPFNAMGVGFTIITATIVFFSVVWEMTKSGD